jgi:hypothetical protein
MDNLFFLCLGFALYAFANYVINMLAAYKEYVHLRSWLKTKGVEITSLDKQAFSKYVSIFRLSEIEGVEIVSIEDDK